MTEKMSEPYMISPVTLSDFGKTRIGVHQVEYSIGPDIPVVHVFGRDASG